MNIKKLIKGIEFVFIVAFAVIGWFLGGFSWVWAIILVGGYVALNLTGWATRPLYQAKDEIVRATKKNKK